MSNISKGLGDKGSKYWIQKLVNLDEGTLNIVNDPTLEQGKHVSEEKWIEHYNIVLSELLGSSQIPEDVFVLEHNKVM